jgi:hypothetical protein
MSTATIQTVNLLPAYLRTSKNAKFLSSTIDQLIQRPQLERLNAYIGTTSTPTYNVGDEYIQEISAIRQAYQLEPALVTYDDSANVNTVVTIDDLANEIQVKGGDSSNFDRVFASEVYSFTPPIDLDKLVNYQNYCWMPNGPRVIDLPDELSPAGNIVGATSYSFSISSSTTTVSLLNGMLVGFSSAPQIILGNQINPYYNKDFFVEGTGTSIRLIPLDSLSTVELSSFGGRPEYITINRASKDLNPWSRYNRWVSEEVVQLSERINGYVNTSTQKARYPIIEFPADIELYNFGTYYYGNVNLFDTVRNTAAGFDPNTDLIDGVAPEHGDKIVFAGSVDTSQNHVAYIVNFNSISGLLQLDFSPPYFNPGYSVSVEKGKKNGGTNWLWNGTSWVYAQQHGPLNNPPMFDLFDANHNSFDDKSLYVTNWAGNKLFGYKVGEGTPNPDLGFPLSYRNVELVGSYLFENYFATGIIPVTEPGQNNIEIPTKSTYYKVGNNYYNTWGPKSKVSISKNRNGNYDIPLSLSNNPLNESIANLTLSNLTKHYSDSNQLVANYNPIAFAMMFIGKIENNVVDAITKSADAYNQFKFSLLTQAAKISNMTNPVTALDEILANINASRTSESPYYLSDMLGCGEVKRVLKYTVTDVSNNIFSITSEFNLNAPSTRSILVYMNNEQLVHGTDYAFDAIDSQITITKLPLTANDVIEIVEYDNTNGCYIPPTPTKLGLYPKYVPQMYEDYTYSNPRWVIQGHDGSITVAYGTEAYRDYRDDILLEYELRVYNNLKVAYRPALFDINKLIPGLFRTTDYSVDEINQIVERDFIRWSGLYNINYTENPTFSAGDPLTWNYDDSYNSTFGQSLNGSWRAIFKYFYDTDRPATHPWEMIGFTEQPSWWQDYYGPGPYTSGNTLMWDDLEYGFNRSTGAEDPLYRRLGLSSIIPVDDQGNQLDPTQIYSLLENATPYNIRQAWKIGDQGPAETAWRRSSFWPFAVQRLLALAKPASYCALMYDPFNMNIDSAGQWSYGTNRTLPNLSKLPIHGENGIATTGYSVFVSEIGKQRVQTYIADLRRDLDNVKFQLFHKVGGFVNHDSLQILIDAYDPTTADAGAILPKQNYELILNKSNPIRSIGLSGLIVQRIDGKFVVTGYDRQNPYFTYYPSIKNYNSPALTVGGVSAEYLTWQPAAGVGSRNLSYADITTASAAPNTAFYQQGQIVQYGGNFYRVNVSHQAETTFDSTLYSILPSLPTTGGVTVQVASQFDSTSIDMPYGQTYESIQDVYDLIMGYGAWLTAQGFVFDQYNADLETVVDWDLTAREFLYWTTQNWINNSIISLSPFADQVVYQYNDSIVDNIFDNFYEYSIYGADGGAFPKKNLFIAREDGRFTINTINTGDGIYYVRLNSVQKEHGMVFDNVTAYGDVIYEPITGQRQHRMKLDGFITANWNGDFFAPGFIYDQAKVVTWSKYTNYFASNVVNFNGNYYSAKTNLEGSSVFDYTKWTLLADKPAGGLLPNFDYKINAFNDFYSLDIDSFDANQQQAAQALTGYVPRSYLNNIFTNKTSQYKFYQGFIREKGTKNPIDKLAKASVQSLNSRIDFTEEWAFRIGQYGSFTSFKEFEVPLPDTKFIENPQVIGFVNTVPNKFNDLVYYVTPSDLSISNEVPNFASVEGDSLFKLMNAGYPQISDVDNTAYDFNSLVNFANNAVLNVGDTIWVGSTGVGDWNVYRYAYVPVGITSATIEVAYTSLLITTAGTHNLSVGELISITNIDTSIDGIYQVSSVLGSTQFTIASTLSNITFIFPSALGMLFKFESVRFATYDSLPLDQILYQYPTGTKVWVDTNEVGRWAVYQKEFNYTSSAVNSIGNTAALSSGQGLGFSISSRKGNNIVVAGLPTYIDTSGNSGKVSVYSKTFGGMQFLLEYSLSVTTANSEFGYSVFYDDVEFNNSGYGLIFAGAPGANNAAGVIQISSINQSDLQQQPIITVTKPAGSSKRFGESIFVQRNTSTKILLVGAPSDAGHVYKYIVTATTLLAVGNATEIVVSDPAMLINTTNWGHAIVGTDDASIYAISAPGYANNSGTVVISNTTSYIVSPFAEGSRFGHSMAMSQTGDRLAVSAPKVINADRSMGAVAVYTLTNSGYVLDQILTNPVSSEIYGEGMNFGQAIDFNTSTGVLVVSSVGTATTALTIFDQGTTTFDKDTTFFTENTPGSGSVYLYERRQKRYVYSEELTTNDVKVTPGSDYGNSITIDDGVILAGAPAITSGALSSVYKFKQIDNSYFGWNPLRNQDTLVNLENIKEIKLINTVKDEVINYYDLHDPLKGKILGIAEQELSYKSSTDPAVYSIGSGTVSVNPNINWLNDHVGELWWDLSTAKFVWYEQGDLEYRRNNWGGLFPGASIDVYEWVESSLLPSEWAAQADTSDGLTSGISGTPKDVTNTTLSFRQVYDPISGSFNNFYYYWVLNKVVVPNVNNRRISAADVRLIIADPSASGIEYAAVIDSNAVMLGNSAPNLVSNNVSLNISIDTENKGIPRHVEWALLSEGNNGMSPPKVLERKMIESILGQTYSETTSTFAGAIVPDPSLSERERYGIDFRPQQTMFKDKQEALRTVVEYANSVLITMKTAGQYNFEKLNDQELPPEGRNVVIEDEIEFEIVDFSTSTVTVLATNTSTIQLDTVTGINIGDNISSNNLNSGLVVVGIDTAFNVIYLSENVATPILAGSSIVLYPTVTVLVDTDTNGGWAVYKNLTGTWERVGTQAYNTTFYWDYVDWTSPEYSKYKLIAAVVDELYQVFTLDLLPGQYAKINNRGDGRYVIVEKLAVGVAGDFAGNFNIMYIEKGTIQISDSLWNNDYGWDMHPFDQLGWNQGPGIEIRNILLALKDDLFIGDLKKYWNSLFFKSVKYAFTEHSEIDWAFKTSFINAIASAGKLNQPPVYKLTDSSFYENYLNEVKPYRTKIRNFITEYNSLEDSQTTIEDFDFQYFNTLTGKFEIISGDLATEYVQTNPVRTITSDLRFDRISSTSTIGKLGNSDTFVSTGNQIEFPLTWLAQPTKVYTTATINGRVALPNDYLIVETTNSITHKKQSTLKFLNDVIPATGSIITVYYQKSIELMTAADRIINYYSPTPGMPGTNLADLIPGIDDPRKIIGGSTLTSVIYDSYINNGTWTGTNLINALGVAPGDITIDGEYGFLSSLPNQAPEEVVPGFIADTLGIDVYTKDKIGSPTIVSGAFSVIASTSTISSFRLSTLPSTATSIFVTFEGTEMVYSETPISNFTNPTLFSIDWFNSTISIPPQTRNGLLGYTILGVGENAFDGVGLIDHGISFGSTVTQISVVSLASVYDVLNTYVTLNGQRIPLGVVGVDSGIFYDLGPASFSSQRAAVTVYNLDPAIGYAVQAWFFGTAGNLFNQVHEEHIAGPIIGGQSYKINPAPDSTYGNLSNEAIVEYVSADGTRRRLLPPDANLPAVYDYTISETTTGTFIAIRLGAILTPNPDSMLRVITFNYEDSLMMQTSKFVGNPVGTYKLSVPVMNVNYVWITVLTQNTMYSLTSGVDYQILNDGRTVRISTNYNIISDDIVEIISFSERTYASGVLAFRQFQGLLGGSSYSRLSKRWSTYLTQPLLAIDTEIHVADVAGLSPPETDFNKPGVVLINGERIEFFAITGTNILTQLRRATLGTGIVDNAPIGTEAFDQGIYQEIPFSDTVLVQSTFTSISTSTYPIFQTSREVKFPYYTATVSSATFVSYGISMSANTTFAGKDQIEVYYGGRLLRKDGYFKHDDQVKYNPITVPYTTGTAYAFTTVGTVLDLPLPGQSGNAYLVTATNQVWVFVPNTSDLVINATTATTSTLYANLTNTGTVVLVTSTNKLYWSTGTGYVVTATLGYVDSGLRYIPEEFTISNTYTSTPLVTLRLNEPIQNNIQLDFVKKQYSIETSWNDLVPGTGTSTVSILSSTNVIATFLQKSPGMLPDRYFYAGR